MEYGRGDPMDWEHFDGCPGRIFAMASLAPTKQTAPEPQALDCSSREVLLNERESHQEDFCSARASVKKQPKPNLEEKEINHYKGGELSRGQKESIASKNISKRSFLTTSRKRKSSNENFSIRTELNTGVSPKRRRLNQALIKDYFESARRAGIGQKSAGIRK